MVKKAITLLSIIFHLSLLISCKTTYQPLSHGSGGGYKDIPTDQKNIVGVAYSGNGVTSPLAINTFMLMRLADIAIQKGYENFYLIESSNDIKTSMGSYTYNRRQTSNSTFSGWSNGNIYTGNVRTTYSIPTTQYYTINKATSYGVALFTDEVVKDMTGIPYYNAAAVYAKGKALNEIYKFWNYKQIGYSFVYDSSPGFQLGFLGGWIYGTMNFHFNYLDYGGHDVYEYLDPSISDTFTGISLSTKASCYTIGTQIPVIRDVLYIPIGVGTEYTHNYDLYDEHYTYIDSYSWFKSEDTEKTIIEVGIMGRWDFLYGQGVFRLVGYKEPSFSLRAGFILE